MNEFKEAYEKLEACRANIACSVKLSEEDIFWLECLKRKIREFNNTTE